MNHDAHAPWFLFAHFQEVQHETKQKAQLERLAFQLDYLGVATPCASHSNHCIGSTDWSAHFDICKASAMIATMSEPPPKTVVVIENLSELATLKPIHSQNHPVFKHDAFAPCYFYARFAPPSALSMLFEFTLISLQRRTKTETPVFRKTLVFWWARVDSNHRSIKQQIYSLSPLATREHAHILFLCRIREPDDSFILA